MRSAIVLFLLSLGPFEPPAPPIAEVPAPMIGAVEERVETVYYDVQGQTSGALAVSLAERGPEYQGQRFFGLTEWEVNVGYRWTERPTGCTMEDVTIHLDVETHLPRRRDALDHDTALRAAWDHFVERLDAHERVHRDLAAEAAGAMREELTALRTEDCLAMRREADQAVAAVMNTYDARHRVYDRFTNHGYTQGAVWPQTSDDWHLASAAPPVPAN